MENKIHILSQSAFWMINKAVTKELGLDASLLLSDLIQRHEYFKNRKMLSDNGSFFTDKAEIEESTTLTSYRQKLGLNILIDKKLVTLRKEGLPCRNWYELHIKRINEFISNLHM